MSQKRDFPWRDNPSPYAVWVSEVMLQQTLSSVVVPYFLRWMERFPTVEALSCASLDEVIKEWEGLGYYSRVRNLHAGAQYVVQHCGGKIPDTYDELSKIRGLGPYTIGAILSFAFHRKQAAVDGNVMRVLTRLFAIDQDISSSKTRRTLSVLANDLLPDEEPWIVSEALIELGATCCKKRPDCQSCPLQRDCLAHARGVAASLPVKGAKIKYETLERTVVLLSHGDEWLLKRGEEGKVMQDLHEFPYFESFLDRKDVAKEFSRRYGIDIEVVDELQEELHTFTRFRARLKAFYCRTTKKKTLSGLRWEHQERLQQLAFSSGHRRLFSSLSFKYL